MAGRDDSVEDVPGLQGHSPFGCGRFAPLSYTGGIDTERALAVRASSNADAGGRVAVFAGSSGRPKRLRVVGLFQRISQSTTVPEPPESLRDMEFDMTRCDSSSDAEI